MIECKCGARYYDAHQTIVTDGYPAHTFTGIYRPSHDEAGAE